MSLFPSVINLNTLLDIGSVFSSAISNFFHSLLDALAPIITAVFNFFTNLINYIIQTLVNFFNGLVNGIISFIQNTIITPFISFFEAVLNKFVSKLDFLLAFWLTTPFAFKLPMEIRKARNWNSVAFAVGKMLLMPLIGWFTGQVIKSVIFHGTPATITISKPSITPITPPPPPTPLPPSPTPTGVFTGLVNLVISIKSTVSALANIISPFVLGIGLSVSFPQATRKDVSVSISSSVSLFTPLVQDITMSIGSSTSF